MNNPLMKTENESSTEESVRESFWINEFLKTDPENNLLKVPIEFITDKFNLVGLKKYIENFEKALNVILDVEEDSPNLKTRTLYNLIHQRYIFTKAGLEDMFEKVMNKNYGTCKNVICSSSQLIPTGLTDIPDIANVKLYCFSCKNLFNPDGPLGALDSCVFGRSFAAFLILTYKSSFEKQQFRKYVPRIFGFRIFEDDK